MNTEKIVNELTDTEIRECFFELKAWMNTGVLKPDGLVRATHQKCEERLNTELSLRIIENQILYIAAERFSTMQVESN